MRKKCLILVMFFSLFGLLFLFGNDVYASDGETNNVVNQEEGELLVNEELTISVLGYSKVYINNSLIENDTTLTESGIYNVKYVEIKTTTEKSTDENGNEVTRNIEQVVETYKTYCLVNVNLLNGETYFEEKEIILDEIENVSYYLNDELIENNIVCANEGLNELKITYNESSKIISFYIFKFNNKEKLNGKNFYEIPTVNYTADTSAKVYLNGQEQEFDGNINTFGNYHFEVKNTKNELIGELAFVIDETIIINGTSYKALNSKITLKNNISLSTQAKIEYELEPLTQTLSGKNIYNGYITYNPGLNTLKITGVGNYDLELAFNITPVTNIIDNHTYTKEVLPIVSGGNVTINGYPYNQGSVINTAGSYEMIINGLEQDNVIKYHFDLLPEEFNVIDNKTYEEALIAAKTNNYMELSNKLYKSGEVIFNEGEYEFKIYYPTYENEKNDLDNNPYNKNTYIKSKYYKVETYNFEIVAGLNIENGKEYYDNIQILFSGASKAILKFEGKENEIESGFIAKKIGNYVLTFNDNDYAFSVTPSLNVEDSHIYLNNVCVLNNYDFNDSNATFTLTCENGTKSASKKSSLTNGEILNEKLASGTYSLEIKNDYYSKVINFIVISSDVVSRGAAYQNGKSFNIDMYGVNVYLNSPRTIDRIRENSLYEGEAIKTIGKHYLTFEFNGINTSSDLDTAIYFYILPIVTLNKKETTSLKLNSDLEAYLTFKDGNYNDIENDNYSPLKLDNNSNSNQINKNSDSTYYFNEIGNHYIDLNLDGYKYRITLTIDSYFYLNEIDESNIISFNSNDTYLSTKNIYKEKVTFVNVDNVDKKRYISYTLDDNDIDINGVTITAVGNHKLYLKGVNNYSKVLTFIIKEDVKVNNELIEIKDSYSDLIYKDAVSFNIFGDAEYLLDKNTYSNNELVETVGNHILTINGTNGYSTNYKFQIKENLIVYSKNTNQNTFDATYDEAFAFEINEDKIKSLKLNDEAINNNIVDINIIGNYELKIEGTNSYTNVYKFNVLPTLSFVSLDDEFNKFRSVYYNTVTPTLDNSKGLHYESVLLNNNSYDFDTLNTIGNYNLVLKGVGNYKDTCNFEIKESLLYSFDNINYSSLNKNINIDENNVGKPIYIKKEFKDIIYINAKLNDDSILESDLNDYLFIDTLGDNLLIINKNTYKIALRELNDSLYLNQDLASSNSSSSVNNIKFNDSLKYDILVDGSLYNDETIESFGLHKVEVNGINYKNTYYFYIDLNTNIINNESYVNNVLIESNAKDFNIYVGSDKLTQELLNKVGNYKITFNGLYGSKETYNINLISNLKIDGNELNDVKTSNIIEVNYVNNSNEYKTILLNGKEFDFSPINTIGKNVLKLIDINGNETNYNLVIDGKNYIKSSVYDNKVLANNNLLDSFELNVNDSYKAKVVMDENPNYYGLHEIIINGVNDYKETYYYSIKLNTNVSNKAYYEALNVSVNANYLIDGKEINNVDEVGNHTLTIYKQNINDFEEVSIDFVIKENVSGFEKENNKAITPIILGNIKSIILSNNSSYKLGDKITKAGYYTLKVIGTNDYESEYEFSLIPLIDFINYDFNSNLNTKEVYIKTDDLTFDLFVNGKAFDINDSINTIGNNTVLIKGFDYEYEKLITLNESIEVLNEYSFDDNYIPTISNLKSKEIYLDGSLYDGLPVTYFGNHILTIKGENNYEASYSFKVNLNTDLINEGIYDKEVVINSNSKILVNEIETNKINLIGNNIVKFIGLNIEEEYIVTLKENVNGYSNDSYKSSHLLSFENVCGIILDDNEIEATNYKLLEDVKEVGNHTFNILGLNGYKSEVYSFKILESIPLLENENTFNNDVLINVENVNGLLLNGKEFVNNQYLNLYGKYELTILGLNGYSNTYNFEITHELKGIEDKGIYVGKAKATSNNSLMFIDGVAYNSNDDIYEVGNHTLNILGYDDEYSIEFTIVPDYSNNEIVNDEDLIINEPKAFYVDERSNLKLTLNDKEYNGEIIDNVGNYTIILKGKNGYTETHQFVIEPIYGEFMQIYDSGFTPIIANNLNYNLYLNDEIYNNGTLINNVGNHKLIIEGIDYKKEFDFVIEESISYLYNDEYVKLPKELILEEALKINNNNDLIYKTLLNGIEFNNLDVINTVGNNILTIVGLNDYEVNYNILLKEKLNINNLDKFNDDDKITPEIINDLNSIILIDGKANQAIQGFGMHEIKVKGVNDYESIYNVYIELECNVINGLVYDFEKEIIINGSFMVDDIPYQNNAIINEVGNHHILIQGFGNETKELSFTIKEQIQGFEDNGIYNDAIMPLINHAKLILDGNEFLSGETISQVGNHVIEVIGASNYKNIYKFTINNKEFIDDQIVDQSLLIDIPNAKLFVDGKEILNNTIISEVGNHTLEVIGTNDYSNLYHFTVNNKEFVNDQVVLGSLLIDIPNAKLFVDGKEIENDTLINEVGYHTLEVIGVNNYSNEYKFTITPDTKIVQTETKNGMVASISSTNICKTISIDDVYYEAGQSYSNIGNHTLTITGSNGYEYKKDFTIDAALGVSDEGVYKDKVTINLLDANEIILDGVEMTKDVVISNGTHTLTIIGANGYEKTVTFTYYNPNNMFVIICTISLCLVFITTLGATLFVKKRKGIK